MLRSLFRELHQQMPNFVAGEPTLMKTNLPYARCRQPAVRAELGFPTMTTAPNPMTSSLDALPRTSDRLCDDLLLPDETVKIRSEAREFATTVLAPRAADLNSAEESKAAFPHDILHAMAAAGLYTIPLRGRCRWARAAVPDVGGRDGARRAGVLHPGGGVGTL